MRIYRNTYNEAQGEHRGYTFHSSQADARAVVRSTKKSNDKLTVDTEVLDVPTDGSGHITKQGWIRFLNKFAGHPNNG